MFHTVVAAALQNIDEADKVAVDVGVRVLQGIAHACLRRQVHDHIKLLGFEQLRRLLAVGQFLLRKLKTRHRLQLGQPVLLQLHVIVIVQIVKADHVVPTVQQPTAQVESDESGRSGDEYLAHYVSAFKSSR